MHHEFPLPRIWGQMFSIGIIFCLRGDTMHALLPHGHRLGISGGKDSHKCILTKEKKKKRITFVWIFLVLSDIFKDLTALRD